jgi:hypothetical protein
VQSVQRVRQEAFQTWAARVVRMCPRAQGSTACGARGRAGRGLTSGEEGCGGHGKCDDITGWCFCWGDWFGERCEHHLFLNSSFLPEFAPDAWPWRCARALQWTMGRGALAEELDARQAERCSRGDTLILDTTGLALGGQINLASLALAHAAKLARPLALHGRWRYAEGRACVEDADGAGNRKSGGRECFFRAQVGCASGVLARGQGGGGGRRMQAHAEGGEVLEHTDTQVVRGGLVPPQRLQGHGLFWWTVQVQSYLTAPSGRLLALKRGAEQALGLGAGEAVLGLHVRRGDACVHAAQSNTRPLCRELKDYIPALAQMRARYGVRTVFVSTDDEGVAQEAPGMLAKLGMRAVSLGLDRSLYASSWFIEHRVEAGAVDGSVIAESMLLDLHLLADCSYLVGTLSSQMSRLALALIAQRLGGPPPFVSVEGTPDPNPHP